MSGSINLFIAQLDKRVDDVLLKKEFEKFGNVRCAEVTKDETGNSMGFGFVHFNFMADGLKAIKELSGKTLLSKTIHVDIANKQITPKRSGRHTLEYSKAESNTLTEHHTLEYSKAVSNTLSEFPTLENTKAELDILPANEQNMSNSNTFEECKVEIRSILITYQKGCYLSELDRAYKSLIGKRLPWRDFNFKSDIDLLHSMPDVVKITPSRNGDYHLQGIADEKSKHIQKMVCKQKPSKLKPPVTRYSRSYNRAYTPIPRFHESLVKPVRNLPVTKPPPVTSSTPLPVKNSTAPPVKNSTAPPVKNSTAPPVKNSTSAEEEVVSLVKRFRNGIVLTDFTLEYHKMYNKRFILSDYGFSSLEECIENVSELDIIKVNNVSYVVHRSESSKFSESRNVERMQEDSIHPTITKSHQNHAENMKNSFEASRSSDTHYRSKTSYNGIVASSMLEKLQKVAKAYPQGIWSTSFPSSFEEVTYCTFDLHSLGYKSLADFIDDIPDIFVRKFVANSKTDYIIYPAGKCNLESNGSLENGSSSLPEIGVSVIDQIILNIQTILEAYSEGIPLKEFLHIYSLNCRDILSLHDLGFDDLETFLSSIKERVPLRIETLHGMKTIHLLKLSEYDIELPYSSPQACKQEAIPHDAAFPEFQFKELALPKQFDFSKYCPVYVSSIVNPSHLYIHMERDQRSEILGKIDTDLENFYNGKQSNLYMMKNVHIKPGVSCVALWPSDQHWYRAQILSIEDMETVKVHYIDYGTRDKIPKKLLRYIKKDLTKLPAQALKCCLSFIRPADNASLWNPEAKQQLLKMCSDKPLMAKIEEIKEDGVFSILLCDTNGEQDVYINDMLRNQGLADYCIEDEHTKSIPASPELLGNAIPEPVQQVEHRNLNPLQALQAQYFLQAFAAVVPSYAQNENYLILLRQISMQCPNAGSGQPPISLNPVVGASSGNLLSTDNQSFMNANLLNNSYPGAASTFQGANTIYSGGMNTQNSCLSPVSDYHMSPRIRSPTPTPTHILCTSVSLGGASMENKYVESEIFEDDDDDMFHEFCQKVSTKSKRFVKRIVLGDGYKIHIILAHSKPYASSGDISYLIWNNKEAAHLYQRLQSKEVEIPSATLFEDGNEELFYQLERLNVKGVQKTSGFKASILLYPLKEVIKILNLFGQPSESLRIKLTDEVNNFDPNDQVWHEFFAPDTTESDEEEDRVCATDDDKIERLCLYDLYAIKEGIKCKRLKMVNDMKNSKNCINVDEITKLEKMQQKVDRRIEEIKEICELYT